MLGGFEAKRSLPQPSTALEWLFLAGLEQIDTLRAQPAFDAPCRVIAGDDGFASDDRRPGCGSSDATGKRQSGRRPESAGIVLRVPLGARANAASVAWVGRIRSNQSSKRSRLRSPSMEKVSMNSANGHRGRGRCPVRRGPVARRS